MDRIEIPFRGVNRYRILECVKFDIFRVSSRVKSKIFAKHFIYSERTRRGEYKFREMDKF